MEREQSQESLGVDSERTIIPSVVAAAHELKSPLILIRQLALGIDNSNISPIEMAERISLTAERALRLTSNITRQARLEDSLFSSEACEASTICREVVHEISPLFSAHGRTIRLSRPRRSSPLVVVNRDLLRRILLAFADNALHYAGEDADVEIGIKVSRTGMVRFSVRDFGPRIPTRLWEQLRSELGVRPKTLANRPLSSGLGLLIAKQFADHMQATIGATRHKDGATFYVDVPVSRQLSLL